jgi:hypothetical protein
VPSPTRFCGLRKHFCARAAGQVSDPWPLVMNKNKAANAFFLFSEAAKG